MSIRKVIDLAIGQAQGDLVGNIAGPITQLYTASSADHWTYAADVDIGAVGPNGAGNVLRSVPIVAAAQNDVLRWGQAGTGVILRRIGADKYSIVGIAPKKLSTQHIMYVDMTEFIGKVVRDELVGRTVRLLTFEEIGEYGGGWGQCPFGAYGHFDAYGNFVELIY